MTNRVNRATSGRSDGPRPTSPAGTGLTRPQALRLARELYESGFSKAEITEVLLKRGFSVHRVTVSRWVDPVAAAAKRRGDRARIGQRALASTGRLGRPDALPEFKFRRMQALHDAGLPLTTIATLMRLDFGDVIGRDSVRDALAKGRYPNMNAVRGGRMAAESRKPAC